MADASLNVDMDERDLIIATREEESLQVDIPDGDLIAELGDGDITVEFHSVALPGRDGHDGVDGRNGDGGLEYSPPSAQAIWLVPHNLGRQPLVSVALPDGEAVGCRVAHLDANTTMIEFGRATSGTARLL